MLASDLRRPVGRSVVDDHQPPAVDRLGKDGIDRSTQLGFAVEYGQNDGDRAISRRHDHLA
jgi:hypothetical protein